METQELIQIENIEAKYLPELQGWREKQEALVEENPFLKIEDNKTYEEAKKRRTALVTGRTTIQNQDKLIASKIKQFRTNVSEASKELIAITQSHEEAQQEEVRRYEKIKAEEKAEKIRIEDERKEKIKNQIDGIFNEWKNAIYELAFTGIESFKLIEFLEEVDTDKFHEFELDFAEKAQLLKRLFEDKKEQLVHAENQRLEDLRLKKQREKFENDQRIACEKTKKEEADRKAKQKIEDDKRAEAQEKIDAENKAKEEELQKKQAKIDAENTRLEKIESDRLAKIEAHKKAKEEEAKLKADKKRIEALQPEKDKLNSIINEISIPISEIPELKDKEAKLFLSHIQLQIQGLKKDLLKELEQLK